MILFGFFTSFIGCLVSELDTAEETETRNVYEWVAPENNWESSNPPASFEGEDGGFEQDEIVPNLEFIDQNGDTVALWQFYGLVVLIDVSTIWCAPCAERADEVEKIQQDNQSKGFIYLTVLLENMNSETPSQNELQNWASDHGIFSAPVLSPKEDYRSILSPNLVYPRLILLDRTLRVVNSDIFPQNGVNIQRAINASL